MSGSPAVMNGMKALRPAARSRANCSSTGFMSCGLSARRDCGERAYHARVVPTDLFVVPALLALYFCYRLRHRRGWVDVLPLPTILLFLFAGYWLWYYHRPQPSPERRELAPGVVYTRESRTSPRPIVVHVVEMDLTTPGLEFVVTPAEPTGGVGLPAPDHQPVRPRVRRVGRDQRQLLLPVPRQQPVRLLPAPRRRRERDGLVR